MLEAELDDHIEENNSLFQNEGFDNEIAQEMAVNAMGEIEPVAEQLEKIHNSDTAWLLKDIITGIALTAFYILIFLFFNTFLGGKCLTAFAGMKLCILIVLSLTLIHLGYKRKSIFIGFCSLAVSLLSFINIITAAVSFSEAFDGIPFYICFSGAVILILFSTVASIFSIQYNHKVNNLKNSKKDFK
ncbi:MAG: hypothetical protein ACI4IQ_00260, partial [Eubacterium sp.]